MVKISKINIMLFRMIKNSKGQFFAVLTIIMVGICIYTSMQMTSVNMDSTVRTYYEENNFPSLFLQTAPVPAQEIETLLDIYGIDKAMGRIAIEAPLVSENKNERVNLRLVTTNGSEEELSKNTLLKGKELKGEEKEVLLIEQFAKARGINPGDTIKVQIKGTQYTLLVVGIVANPEYIYIMENVQAIMPDDKHFGVCYISEKFGQQISGLSGSYNEILIDYKNVKNEDAIIDEVKKNLDSYGIKSVIKQKNQMSNAIIHQELKQLKTMAQTIPILFLMVAGLILMMMLSRMVKKDRIKIGVLKAVGYGNGQVLFHYVKYALVCGIIGGAVGSVLGMALAGGMTRMYLDFFNIPLLRVEFYYSYLFLAILLSGLFCIFSGLVGARGVLKIAPADAMRSDAPKAGKRIFLERITFFWKRLPFSSKMIVKNIFRNKKRTLFILSGVTVTYAMMLFTTSMPQVMDKLMIEHFKEFQKMDYNINFRVPVNEKAADDLSHVADITYIEGKLEFPFELASGNKTRAVSIIGLEKNTKFYSFKDINGENINLPEKGILLSENLAASLGVKQGDVIQVKSYISGREDQYIQVKGVIKQALGMNAYMEMAFMGEKLVEKNVITGVYLDSKDKSLNEKLIKLSNIGTIMSVSEIRDIYDEYMAMMVLSIGFMIIFSGILGFCIVYNATIVSLGEREMEFSSMRVLGFSRGEIFMMILKENSIIMVLGIILGLPVGKLMLDYSSRAFTTDLYTLTMNPSIYSTLMAIFYTIVFIIIGQLATYIKIHRLDFLQALKNRAS